MPPSTSQLMPATAPPAHRAPELLVVTLREPTCLPEPLALWSKEQRISLHMVGNLYEAAEKMGRSRSRWAALVVDPEGLTRSQCAMLATIKRHVVLPIWSLPNHSRGHRDMENLLPWEQAMRALSRMLVKGDTPLPDKGSNKHSESLNQNLGIPERPPASAPPASHNRPLGGPGKRAEMPVTSQLAAGYDEQIGAPVLTDMEIQALLGPVDPKE